MKKYYLKYTFFVISFLTFSCSKYDDETEINDFKGFYQINSITSSLPLDLNNDGIKSNNYLQEIKSNYISYNGEIIDYGYNNELKYNFAEARPTKYQINNNTQFLDIRFPIQRIDSIYLGSNNFVKMNMEYRNMGTGLIYKLSKNNIEIESDPFNHFEFYGMNNFEINRISKEEFILQFHFKVFDFTDSEWIETRLIAKYLKVKE